ncbi:S-ribosylhomocysteine lyase [Garciella nitratireducens]|uniref:S-ribosylhomocysteine lyase n=1 Tax=Garciella nitratireducens TaxID=218205 RepID=UPI000DEB7CEA|nr:S-ribosylhomocysteine lyase [Garciella nitratireducens]RBP46906.1 S-ribosylhomocysteine lyase /quorum-sensing autoinducer 2 (AI-2) synthesis protein LuxS [Garciella nitratireducens]
MLSKSFGVDHLKLQKGLYLSQIDHLEGTSTLTFDIRIRKPYVDPILTNIEVHTFEHCLATGVREYLNESSKKGILPIYIGPMGCATGFYIVLQFSDNIYGKENYYPVVYEILEGAISKILEMTEIPAKDKKRCGNVNTLGGIEIAYSLAKEFKQIIEKTMKSRNFDEYPMLEE